MQGLPKLQAQGCNHSQAEQFDFDPRVSFQMSGFANSNLNWNWYWKENEGTKTPSSSRFFRIHSQGRHHKESDCSIALPRAIDGVEAMENTSKPRWVKHRTKQRCVVSSPTIHPFFYSTTPHATQQAHERRGDRQTERERALGQQKTSKVTTPVGRDIFT